MVEDEKCINLTLKAPEWSTFEEIHIQMKTVLTTKMYKAHLFLIKTASVY